jgi:hypothetical protein
MCPSEPPHTFLSRDGFRHPATNPSLIHDNRQSLTVSPKARDPQYALSESVRRAWYGSTRGVKTFHTATLVAKGETDSQAQQTGKFFLFRTL